MPTPTPSSTSSDYPRTLREHAFELYCSGLRSPAIAKQLAVPERTIRAWLAATCQQLSQARSGTAQAAAALAEARQLQIAAAAWTSYRRHAEAEQHQLDDLRFATHDELESGAAPRLSAAGARYLAIALRATDLAARLSGAYTCPPPQPAGVDFHILSYRPGPECFEPPRGPNVTPLTGLELERYQHQEWVAGLQSQIASDQAQLATGRARLAELDALLAPEPGSQSPLSAPADPDFAADDDEHTAETPTDFPAESATATATSESSTESATAPAASAAISAESATALTAETVRPCESPAESATPTNGFAAGFGSPRTPTSPSLASANLAVSPLPAGGVRSEASDHREAEGAQSEAAEPGARSLPLGLPPHP